MNDDEGDEEEYKKWAWLQGYAGGKYETETRGREGRRGGGGAPT